MAKTNQSEHEESLRVYAEGLMDHAVDAGVEDLSSLFDERVDELTFDREALQEVHFQIGYITCAAELRGTLPEELLDELVEEDPIDDAPEESGERPQLGRARCASHKVPRRSPSRTLPDNNTH